MPPRQHRQELRRPPGESKEFDRAVAQLMDYGFSPEDARRGLSDSGAGLNVQAAANWLLDDAHRRAKDKAQGRSSSTAAGQTRPDKHAGGPTGRSGDADLAKSAAAVGTSLFKTANSLWKTGQKKMQQAVADFQQEGGADPSQPKWMRDTQKNRSHDGKNTARDATDEALALETGGRPRPAHAKTRQATEQRQQTGSPATSLSGSQSRASSVPRWQQKPVTPPIADVRSRLSRMKMDDDDDNFSSYVSANRRKKTGSTAARSSHTTEIRARFIV